MIYSIVVILLTAICINAAFLIPINRGKHFRTQLASLDENNGETKTQRGQHVPILGPIPGAPPLLLGGELILDPPTPLQWDTLEESVLLHQQYLQEQEQSSQRNEADDNLIDEMSTSDRSAMTAGIDAAPLVAVIHDVTGGKGYV